ncbi:MAG: UDP-N-acetylglucosamine 1-carboxyvinyltransferase [bacterium]
MDKFIIHGGKTLKGEIEVVGAKNATTPILAACLLTDKPCIIDNLPLIEDCFRMLDIFEDMGVDVEWLGKHKVKITADKISPQKIDRKVVGQLRSSILLLGPLSTRFKNFKLPQPGGCVIGARTTMPHTNALNALGINIKEQERDYLIKRKELSGTDISMNEFSVTATENVLMAAVLAKGRTIITYAAIEPHVQDLCYFLKKMGAKISGIGSYTLVVDGVDKLNGTDHFLIYDPIEMCSFISLAGATKGSITIKNIIPEFIGCELNKFREVGLNFEIKNRRKFRKGWGYEIADIEILPTGNLRAVRKAHNMPYPGFAADNLPPFAAMMTQAEGTSLIHDWMFEGRLRYIDDLNKMGANAIICDPHRALITGPVSLYGTSVTSYDLRAGMTLIIAALIAQGETEISEVYQVDRGYEKIEERLQKLGADIKRVEG